MSRLTRDWTAEPLSRGQILRRERGQLTTSRIGNLTRIMLTLAICVTVYTSFETIDFLLREAIDGRVNGLALKLSGSNVRLWILGLE